MKPGKGLVGRSPTALAGGRVSSLCRVAVLHAPAAFISSAASTKTLVERILNRPTNPDAYLEKAVIALSSSSSHPLNGSISMT